MAAEQFGMSTVVLILRAVSLLAFGGPLLMGMQGRRRAQRRASGGSRGSRVPLLANLCAFGLFFALLVVASGTTEGWMALLLALLGALLAVGGAAITLKSRLELGAAWSFVPRASEQSGPVTTGPYRLIRHPIYLGLSMLAAGEAVAFCNWPALLAVLATVVPTFLWRARVEEDLLARVFGERYLRYREGTKMIVPYLL